MKAGSAWWQLWCKNMFVLVLTMILHSYGNGNGNGVVMVFGLRQILWISDRSNCNNTNVLSDSSFNTIQPAGIIGSTCQYGLYPTNTYNYTHTCSCSVTAHHLQPEPLMVINRDRTSFGIISSSWNPSDGYFVTRNSFRSNTDK
jgi:hypothetical protein